MDKQGSAASAAENVDGWRSVYGVTRGWDGGQTLYAVARSAESTLFKTIVLTGFCSQIAAQIVAEHFNSCDVTLAEPNGSQVSCRVHGALLREAERGYYGLVIW